MTFSLINKPAILGKYEIEPSTFESFFIGSSLENKTSKCLISLLRSSSLMTFASGHVCVLEISVIDNFVGSSLLAVPKLEIILTLFLIQFSIIKSFPVTLSIASTT